MPDRERAADRGSRLARHDLVTVGVDLRTARITAGKTLREVGRAVGMSYSTVGRIERAALPSATVAQLARIGAVVGLDVRVRAYPGATPLRDAAQIALFDRLRARLAPGLVIRMEVPLQIEGDLRAWDAVISGFEPEADPLHVEGETRLYDAQAQLRRLALKVRDSGVETVLLVMADTPRKPGSRQGCRADGDGRLSHPASSGARSVGRRSAPRRVGPGVRLTPCSCGDRSEARVIAGTTVGALRAPSVDTAVAG